MEIENLLDLLQLSHEFKIEKLRKLCESTIEPAINIENCALILKKAHEIGMQAEELKTACLNYILFNYQQVIMTAGYYELPKELIKEVN